jgi:hypothetical protein
MSSKAVPPDPLMGTTEETFPGSEVYYYAFGGAPKSDWSGIEDLDSHLLSDLCFRALDPVAGQKSTHYRIKGLEKQFDRTMKLSDFQKMYRNILSSSDSILLGSFLIQKIPRKSNP